MVRTYSTRCDKLYNILVLKRGMKMPVGRHTRMYV
jgi:hypothetical protein